MSQVWSSQGHMSNSLRRPTLRNTKAAAEESSREEDPRPLLYSVIKNGRLAALAMRCTPSNWCAKQSGSPLVCVV